MEYSVGSIGRVFTVRIDHGENPIEQITKIVVKEQIQQASFTLIGAVGSAKFVSGPREKTLPPEVVWKDFDDVHEILGVGNIFRENNKPKIHLHSAFGSKHDTQFGCLRQDAEAFMVIEATIFELTGFKAIREHNEALGFSPINFKEDTT